MNRKRRIWVYAVGVPVLMLIFFFLLRNVMLGYLIKRISAKVQQKYQVSINVDGSSFSGFSTVVLNGITAIPVQGDTLFHLDSLRARPSLSSLLFLNIQLRSLEMRSGFIHLVSTDSIQNFSSLAARRKDSTTHVLKSADLNYASLANRIFSAAFDFAPQFAVMNNLELKITTDSFRIVLFVPHFQSTSESMEGILEDVLQSRRWKVQGTFDQDERRYDATIYPLSNNSRIPVFREIFKVTSGFDTLRMALESVAYSKSNFRMSGKISTSNFAIYHNKISMDTVRFEQVSFLYDMSIAKNSISLDSTSFLMVNKIPVHPRINYSKAGSKVYELSLYTDTVSANDFFGSLPSGIFDETNGARADGRLKYSLVFRLDSANPDSVIFDSRMDRVNFRIRKPGKENLFKLNEEFIYTVYESNIPFRSFPVGPSNPDFTPLEQISPFLRNAVLTSEDGSFFFHNGFNEDAFRKSIAENYRKGRFVRGGSTISMQLVKNVFLSRNKTIARKVEEALIVWLIESGRLCSKERMFEVYLNIIELGPGIYGIGEASRFYFNNKPAELSLNESIFLASLLPRPKGFKYSFDSGGNLKPYFADYYRVVSNFLLRKNLITQEEYDQIRPFVQLKGPAKEMVVVSDTVPTEPETENELPFINL